MTRTEQYSPVLMEQYYLVHAGINDYVWFDTFDQAIDFLHSLWVDSRITTQVQIPVKWRD